MSSNKSNSESPDIPDEDMYDPASTNFEAISETVDPFESYTEDDFPKLPGQRNEAQQNELNKSSYCIEPKSNLTANTSQPKLKENMKQPDQNRVKFSAAQLRNQSCTTEINEKLSLNAPINTKDAILHARDLLVLGYRLTNYRMEQARLLDLLEIFREYTEQGILSKASKIIASQITNLERATRQIETKARDLKRTNTSAGHNIFTSSSQKQQTEKHGENMQPTQSMATVASNGATKSNVPQEWIVVGQ
ncbi:hypothetical protein GcC1_154005, partial [Golovinomyces cichoracearum]